MKVIIFVLSIVMIGQFSLLAYFIRQYANEQENNRKQRQSMEALQQTVKALQRDDIQRLIGHVKKVMAGEIIYERETNILSRYSYHKDSHPTMDSIESDLNVLNIYLDGDSGEIKVLYSIIYLDSSGRTVRGVQATPYLPTIWVLERQGEDWVIVEIIQGKDTLNRP